MITSPGWVPAGTSTVTAALVGQLERGRAAERRLGERDVAARDEIGAVALEALVGRELDVDVEVAGRAALLARHPLTRDAQPLARRRCPRGT